MAINTGARPRIDEWPAEFIGAARKRKQRQVRLPYVVCQSEFPQLTSVGAAWLHWLLARVSAAPALMQPIERAARVGKVHRTRAGLSLRDVGQVLVDRVWLRTFSRVASMIAVHDALASAHGPLLVISGWQEGMDLPDNNGYVRRDPERPVNGWHAFIITGYDKKRAAFRGVNCRGIAWGQLGRFWIDETTFEDLTFGMGGEIAVAIPAGAGHAITAAAATGAAHTTRRQRIRRTGAAHTTQRRVAGPAGVPQR